jgi:hypothetical protein
MPLGLNIDVRLPRDRHGPDDRAAKWIDAVTRYLVTVMIEAGWHQTKTMPNAIERGTSGADSFVIGNAVWMSLPATPRCVRFGDMTVLLVRWRHLGQRRIMTGIRHMAMDI